MKINCYKVVHVLGGEMYSYLHSFLILPDDLLLTYKVGIPTKPNIGKIFVFDTLEHALDDMKNTIDNSSERIEIWAAYGTGLKTAETICPVWGVTQIDEVIRFWKSRRKKSIGTDGVTRGTMFANSVTLIKRVTRKVSAC